MRTTPDGGCGSRSTKRARLSLTDRGKLGLLMLTGAGCTLHSLDYLDSGALGAGGSASVSSNSAFTTSVSAGSIGGVDHSQEGAAADVSGQGGSSVDSSTAAWLLMGGSGGGRNLALGKPSTAATAESSNPAENGNDASLTTRWCAAGGAMPEWWMVDLEQPFAITGTQVIWEFDGRTYRYLIEVSLDASNWKSVVDKRSTTSTAQIQRDAFAVQARYVRITVTSATTSPLTWASLFDFAVFGS